MCTCECVEARGQCRVSPSITLYFIIIIYLFLKQDLSLNKELVNLVRLPGQKARGNLPFSTFTVLRLDACNTMPGFLLGS